MPRLSQATLSSSTRMAPRLSTAPNDGCGTRFAIRGTAERDAIPGASTTTEDETFMKAF